MIKKYFPLTSFLLCSFFALVANGQTKKDTSNFSLTVHQLDSITVESRKTINERTSTIGKSGIAPKDLPQAITIINRETLENQQVQQLSDVLKNVNGVYIMGTTGGTQEEIAGRGYAFNSSNTFKNGVRFNNAVLPEMSSLERVEVLKGSNAILYGNVSAGGVLNLVTRKPQFKKGGEMSFKMGSYDFYKTSVDLYGAINNSAKLAYRINTSYEKGNSFRNSVHSERFYINPSFLYQISSKTNVLIETDYVTDTRTVDYGTGAINYQIADIPRERFLGTDWQTNKAIQQSITATTTHKINTKWELKNTSNYSTYANELFSTTRPNSSNNFIQPDGKWIRGIQRSAATEQYMITQFDLIGNFTTGKIQHQVLFGADLDQYQNEATAYNSLAKYDSINIYNESLYKRRNDIPDLTKSVLTKTTNQRTGLYAQDLISFTKEWKLLVGLRQTFLKTNSNVYQYKYDTSATVQRNDQALSPRIGIVYQPNQNLSFFTSYANSFTLNTALDTTGNPLTPSIINQYEMGMKADLFKRNISLNITTYQIINSNLAQAVVPPNPRFPSAQELAGEVTSRGLEIDFATRPIQGISFIAGYSFNETKYTKSTVYEEGSKLRYNPQHTANFSLFHQFSDKNLLKGFNYGLTIFYTGERVAGRSTRKTVANDSYQLMPVPDYTTVDAMLGYSKNGISIRCKVSNIFNVLSYNVHDDNSVNPIAPTLFSASIACKL